MEGLIISKKYNLYSYIIKLEILQLYFLQKNNVYEISYNDMNEELKLYLNKVNEYFDEFDKAKYVVYISTTITNLYKNNKEAVDYNNIISLLDSVYPIIQSYESRKLKKLIFMSKALIYHINGDIEKREEFAKLYNTN